MGLVTPVGNDVASTWAALVAGESGAGPITRFDSEKLPVHFACEVKGYDPLQYIEKKEARRYDLFSQFAMGAAVQGRARFLHRNKPARSQTDRCDHRHRHGWYRDVRREHADVHREGAGPRVAVLRADVHGQRGLRNRLDALRLPGPNYCTVSACASSGHALGDAFDLIREGKGRRHGRRRVGSSHHPRCRSPASPT